jgi:hypothetical protein
MATFNKIFTNFIRSNNNLILSADVGIIINTDLSINSQTNLKNLTFIGVTGENEIIIPNNVSNAFDINDGINDYISISTVTPLIKLLQNTNITGDLTTTGLVNTRDIESDGIDLDSVLATGITNMTSSEINQLEKIDNVTISNTQWGYLGSMDQPVSTTSLVNFNQVIVDQITLNNNEIKSDNLEIKDSSESYIRINSTSPSIEILKCLVISDILEPSNPLDGYGKLYKKTGNDGLFWKPDSTGSEVDLTSSSISSEYNRTFVSTTPYNVLINDEIIGVNTTSIAITIILPQITSIGGTNNYKKYYIVDEEGNATINNITIETTSGDTINKNISPMLVNINHTSITLYNDGISNWIIL